MTSEGRERDSIHRPDEATPVSHDAPTIPSGVVERAVEAERVVREEMAGDSFGDYERREVLGEGGFGIVYACEQLRPIRRRVALKVLKLGMDSREILGRFEAERVLTESVTMLEASVGAASDRTKMAASKFVKLYEAWGKPDEAAKWRERAK